MKTIRILAVMALSTVLVQSATAQPLNLQANRKITGQYFQPHTAHVYHRSAVAHARVLRHYTSSPAGVSAEPVQEHVAAVRHNIKAAEKEFAKLKKEATEAHDDLALKLIASIESHYKKAAKACGMAEVECLNEDGNPAMIGKCCTDMLAELKAADADYAKLRAHLKVASLEEAEHATETK